MPTTRLPELDSDLDSDAATQQQSWQPPTLPARRQPREIVEDEAAAVSGLAGLRPVVGGSGSGSSGGSSGSVEDKDPQLPDAPPKLPKDDGNGSAPVELSAPPAPTHKPAAIGSVLGSSFGGTRQRRSTSVGAEALKRFQRAFPSLAAVQLPLGLRHAISTSLFSFGDKEDERKEDESKVHAEVETQSKTQTQTPPALRRCASDDSLLYHTMSRMSVDDDGRFDNVRAMSNVRMIAIREILPDRPVFKIPTLSSLPSMPNLSNLPSLSSLPSLSGPPKPATAVYPDTPTTAPLDRVLETLTGDIVVLGGYRGSVLRDATPPHHQLWAPVKLGLNMRKVDLELGLLPEDEAQSELRAVPSGMLQHIGPIDISRRLIRRLRACDAAKAGSLRTWDYGYDWRLSPALLSRKLEEYLEKLPCNQKENPEGAWVIAHSRGFLNIFTNSSLTHSLTHSSRRPHHPPRRQPASRALCRRHLRRRPPARRQHPRPLAQRRCRPFKRKDPHRPRQLFVPVQLCVFARGRRRLCRPPHGRGSAYRLLQC